MPQVGQPRCKTLARFDELMQCLDADQPGPTVETKKIFEEDREFNQGAWPRKKVSGCSDYGFRVQGFQGLGVKAEAEGLWVGTTCWLRHVQGNLTVGLERQRVLQPAWSV